MNLRLEAGGRSFHLTLDGDEYSIRAEDTTEPIATGVASVQKVRPGTYSVLFDDGRVTVVNIEGSQEFHALAGSAQFAFQLSDLRDRRKGESAGSAAGPREVRSPMPGKIIKVLVNEGQTVETDDGLLVMEAMKMQNEAKAPKAGVVRRIAVVEGAAVAAGELLAVID